MYKTKLKVRLITVLMVVLILSFSGGCVTHDEIVPENQSSVNVQGGAENPQAVKSGGSLPGQEQNIGSNVALGNQQQTMQDGVTSTNQIGLTGQSTATAQGTVLNTGQVSGSQNLIITNGSAHVVNEQRSAGQTATNAADGSQVGPFSGKLFTEFQLKRPVMVMVENSPAARPQVGLEDASIVYEFLAEGGITRFLVLYYESFPERVGPVRSTRPYFIDTALEYNALLLHAGASAEGYAHLAQTKIAHFDQITTGAYYWRDSARQAPHNLYTGVQKLASYFKKSKPRVIAAPRFPFEAASLIDSTATKQAQEIAIKYWGNYTVRYLFDQTKGNYLRFIAGAPHVMEGGKKLYADNIFIQYVDTKVKDNEGRLGMELTGRGTALLFRDGYVFSGTWEKKAGEQTRFLDRQGKTLEVNPGQTWIQVVPTGTKVDYK